MRGARMSIIIQSGVLSTGRLEKIDRILKRNRRVMKKLYHSDRTDKLFEWEELVRCGFDFGFRAHIGDAGPTILCY